MMTKDEALKMAIEALEQACGLTPRDAHFCKAIQACKEALEQPAQEHLCTYSRAINQQYPRKCIHCGKVEALAQPAQEPVSLGDFDNMTKAECVDYIEYLRKEIDLLRFKEWQGLSDGDIQEHLGDELVTLHGWSFVQGVRWANKKLKEKNHVAI